MWEPNLKVSVNYYSEMLQGMNSYKLKFFFEEVVLKLNGKNIKVDEIYQKKFVVMTLKPAEDSIQN